VHRNASDQPGSDYRLRLVHAVRSNTFAGVERYVVSVCAALAARGHEAVVIASNATPFEEALGDNLVPVRSASGTLGMAAAIARQSRHADLVHVHMTAAEVAATLAWPVARTPIVTTRHFPRRRGSSVLGRLAAPVVSRVVTAELAISRFVADSVRERTEIVLNGVEDDLPVDPVAPVVLVAQRLEPEKHSRDAIDAWQASGLADEGWQLWIAGDGSERASLESIVERRAHAAVRFLGYRPDLRELRRTVGIFLATAPAEPFGLSVAEAMAAGLPVVAAGAGGHHETVGAARADLLYPPGDTEACGLLLRRLADDLAFRRHVGHELRAFQQRALGLDRHVDRLLRLYRRVLADTRGRIEPAPA
jgi:glycosyltransferase involved in cell wall biosynthesis